MRYGRWLRIRGQMKKWWAKLTRDESLGAPGDADIITGAFQESYGRVKKDGVREASRRIDALAGVAKRTLRQIDSAL
jgi:uncharacterized protein YjbJ (UPF0337 family)